MTESLVTAKEAILRLADLAADRLDETNGGIVIWSAAGVAEDGGEETGLSMIVGMGKAQVEFLQAHFDKIEAEAKEKGLGAAISNVDEAQAAVDSILPKEDAQGCRSHEKYKDCVNDFKSFIRGCWEPIYKALADNGTSFVGVKDAKQMRTDLRKGVAAGVAVGLRMAKDGCRGYLRSKFKP